MTTNRIDHSGHNHPATAAGRKACRAGKAVTASVPNRPTIRTAAGLVREGSIIRAQVRGGSPAVYTVRSVSEDIKNGYAGWNAEGRWGYADQVTQVVKF